MSHKQESRNNKKKAIKSLEVRKANIKKSLMKNGGKEILKKLWMKSKRKLRIFRGDSDRYNHKKEIMKRGAKSIKVWKIKEEFSGKRLSSLTISIDQHMLNQKRTRKQPLRNKDKSNNKKHRTNKTRHRTNKTRQRRNTRQELDRLLPSSKFLDSEEAGKFSFKLNQQLLDLLLLTIGTAIIIDLTISVYMIGVFCIRHTFLTDLIEIQSMTIHTYTTEIHCTRILPYIPFDPISDLHPHHFRQ